MMFGLDGCGVKTGVGLGDQDVRDIVFQLVGGDLENTFSADVDLGSLDDGAPAASELEAFVAGFQDTQGIVRVKTELGDSGSRYSNNREAKAKSFIYQLRKIRVITNLI